MIKIKNVENGFAIVEIVMVLVIVILLVIASSLVYSNHQRKNAASSTSGRNTSTKVATPTKTSPTQPKPTTPKPQPTPVKVTPTPTPAPTPTLHTGAEAVNLVQKAFDTASAYVKRTNNVDQGEVDSVKAYLSPDLYMRLSNSVANGTVTSDQFACAQAIPDSATVSLASTAGSQGSVSVIEAFGPTSQTVNVSVDLSALLITAIKCPTS